jgi:hypothetical protein
MSNFDNPGGPRSYDDGRAGSMLRMALILQRPWLRTITNEVHMLRVADV